MPFPSDGIKSRTIRRFEQLTDIEFQFDFLILNVPLTPKFNTRIAINRWINFIDIDIVTLAKEDIFNSVLHPYHSSKMKHVLHRYNSIPCLCPSISSLSKASERKASIGSLFMEKLCKISSSLKKV